MPYSVEISNVTKMFGKFSALKGVNLQLQEGEVFAYIGPNGAGKTTLLRVCTGEIEPDAGEVRWGVAVDWGFYRQGLDDLEDDNTVVEELMGAAEMTLGEARNMLGRFLFRGDDVYKKVSVLSGGERSRVMLAKLFLMGANCLLLDEPTNHLDIPAREVLEEALRDFGGTLIVVSHDRYFVDQVATAIWELDAGTLRTFQGGWSAYQESLQQERSLHAASREAVEPAVDLAQSGGASSQRGREAAEREARRQRQLLETELARLEAELAELEREKLGLEWEMAEASFSQRADRNERLSRYKELPLLLEQGYQRWEKTAADLGDSGETPSID